MSRVIVNAEDKVLGRLASEIAGIARDGDEVHVVNAEKAVISGDEKQVKQEYKDRKDRGSRHTGPHYPKSPARILKRSVKGMLPKNREGREALSRVKTYIGVPEDLEPGLEETAF